MSYDMKEFIKKSWFVILVGICFISIAIYFAWDTNKDTIGSKSSKGKDVIFSLADKNYTADEYYKSLFDKTRQGGTTPTGVQLIYTGIERAVINKSVKTTDKMQKDVDTLVKNAEINLKQQYGATFKDQVASDLIKLGYSGYSDLEQYFIDYKKTSAFMIQYLKDHPDTYASIAENDSPRVISQILVKMDVKDTSTDEEKATAEASAQTRMANIDKELETKDFGAVAETNSDDSTKANKGSMGIQTKKSSLNENFKTAAWGINENEVSGWVKTDKGYVKIKIGTTDVSKMIKDADLADSFITMVLTEKPTLQKEVIWAKAKELKMSIKDKDIEKKLTEFISKEQ